jgi:hypothetical protein
VSGISAGVWDFRTFGVWDFRTFSVIEQRIAEMQAAGVTAKQIAERLNQEGFRTARQHPFSRGSVYKFMARQRPPQRRNHVEPGCEPQEHEWWARDLATKLGVCVSTLVHWRRRGWLGGRTLPEATGRWIYWADEAEVNRLQTMRSYQPKPGDGRRYPKQLTTPTCPQHYLVEPVA